MSTRNPTPARRYRLFCFCGQVARSTKGLTTMKILKICQEGQSHLSKSTAEVWY